EDKKLKALRNYFAEADERMEIAERDLKFLAEFQDYFDAIEDNLSQLEGFYYEGDWAEKREVLQNSDPKENFKSTGEDAIWQISQEFYLRRIKILKQLTDSIHKRLEGA